MLIILQMKQLSELVFWIQNNTLSQYSEIGTLDKNFLKRQQLNLKNMWLTRQTWMVPDKLCSIIVQVMWWIQLFGTLLVGRLRKTVTLIKTVLNIESNLTNQNLSKREKSEKAPAESPRKRWLMNLQTWESQALEALL